SWFQSQLGNQRLIESAPLRREQDQSADRLSYLPDGLGRRDHRRSHQDHSWAASERPVVYLLVFPLRPVADIESLDADQPSGNRPTQDALVQVAVKDGRKQSQDVDAMR